MKRALVLSLMIAVGLGLGAIAADGFSGSWKSELTIGFKDFVITYPGENVTVGGFSNLPVSEGLVTIPERTISWSFAAKTYTYTIPEKTYVVGPWEIDMPAMEYPVTGATVTIPSQQVTVTLGASASGTVAIIPGGTYDVHPGKVKLDFNYGPILVEDRTTHQTWSCTVADVVITQDWDCCECKTEIDLPDIVIPVSVCGNPANLNLTMPKYWFDCCSAGPITIDPKTVDDGNYRISYPGQSLVKGTDYECQDPYVVLTAVDVTVNVTGTATGTITIPASDPIDVVNGRIQIPAYKITVPADSIVVAEVVVSITVDGQSFTYVIPEQNLKVSAQTVTVPSQVITVHPWTTTLSDIPTLAFESTLTINYATCGWLFTSITGFSSEGGWVEQEFTAAGELGAFSIESSLIFDPAEAAFVSWDSTVDVSIAGVMLTTSFALVPSASGFSFGASGGAGACTLGAMAYFNLDEDGVPIAGTCVCFTSVHFDFGFSFACVDVDVDLDFSASGFDGITFAVEGIQAGNLPFLSFGMAVTFDDGATGKVVAVTPTLVLGSFDCITLYAKLLGTFPQITGIDVYGAKLAYTWNGITFTDVTVFDTAAYKVDSALKIVTGTGYWEAFQLKFDGDACCGGAFGFSVTTFFETGSDYLFDWGETTASFSIGLGSNYTVTTSLNIDDVGLRTWVLGFEVTF